MNFADFSIHAWWIIKKKILEDFSIMEYYSFVN